MHEHPPSRLERLLAFPVATTGLRGVTFLSTMLLNTDLFRHMGRIAGTFNGLARTVRYFRPAHDFSIAVNMIDDRMDTTPPEWLLQLPAPQHGTVPSAFLTDPQTIPREFTFALNALIEQGIAPRDAAIAYCNILAIHSRQRAVWDKAFRENPTPDNRQRMADENTAITEAYTIFFMRCLTGNWQKSTDYSVLTYHDVVREMPETALISGIGQVTDDLRDFLVDMEGEFIDGIPTPNWLACQMGEESRTDEMRQYVARQSGKFVADTNPPIFVQDAIQSGLPKLATLIDQLPRAGQRATMWAFINNTLKEGFKSSFHPDVIDKDIRRANEKQTLIKKYAGMPDCVLT